MRPGGVLLADNVFADLGVLPDHEETANTPAIAAFNAHVRADDRVETVMLAIADGLTLARVR
jgi:caffeoyl-CoA O-methyltransferase